VCPDVWPNSKRASLWAVRTVLFTRPWTTPRGGSTRWITRWSNHSLGYPLPAILPPSHGPRPATIPSPSTVLDQLATCIAVTSSRFSALELLTIRQYRVFLHFSHFEHNYIVPINEIEIIFHKRRSAVNVWRVDNRLGLPSLNNNCEHQSCQAAYPLPPPLGVSLLFCTFSSVWSCHAAKLLCRLRH